MKNIYILFSISILLMGFGLLMVPGKALAWSSYSPSASYGYGMNGGPYGYNTPYTANAFSGAGAYFGYDSSSNIRPATLLYGHMDQVFGFHPAPVNPCNQYGSQYGGSSGYSSFTNVYNNNGYQSYNTSFGGYNTTGTCYGYGC